MPEGFTGQSKAQLEVLAVHFDTRTETLFSVLLSRMSQNSTKIETFSRNYTVLSKNSDIIRHNYHLRKKTNRNHSARIDPIHFHDIFLQHARGLLSSITRNESGLFLSEKLPFRY